MHSYFTKYYMLQVDLYEPVELIGNLKCSFLKISLTKVKLSFNFNVKNNLIK